MPDNLSGLSLITAAFLLMPEPWFFSLTSYVSNDVLGKKSASWVIYLYNEGFSFSLGQQASPLRKRSLPLKELIIAASL